jgi:formate dehydrogenase subunit gamma
MTLSLQRFSRAERWVHRLTATLMMCCIVTAFVLYNGSVSIAIGHRRVVELIHVYCGFALPVPMFLGLASVAYRSDLRRLNRFSRADWAWLRSRTRRSGAIVVGKFNGGQKLNSWLVSGSILVLLGTGIVMFFVGLAPLSWRTGATFVHDWFALGLGMLVIGHIYMASRDPEARRGMRHGGVSEQWARSEHLGWLSEMTPANDHQTKPAGTQPAAAEDSADT